MSERLSAADMSFLYVEDDHTPMHIGDVLIFTPPRGGFAYDKLTDLIADRLEMVPRYRQKIAYVPGNISGPRWVDDENFDVHFHVRRSALPKPGGQAQLAELVSRLMSRRLDRDRPLWEIYLVEGLSRGRVAIITKTHSALVNGIDGMEIGEVLLDATREPAPVAAGDWVPRRTPTPVGLLLEVLRESVSTPRTVLDSARAAIANAKHTGERIWSVGRGALAATQWIISPAKSSPINVNVRGARRFAMSKQSLADFKAIKDRHGCAVNDVVLAVIAGALRSWMLARGSIISREQTLRALVPLSVKPIDADAAFGETGQLTTLFVDLPLGEENPVLRLSRIAFSTRAHRESGLAVAADALVPMTRFAPPTLHSLGARVGQGLTRRGFNLVVTNAPGPQSPMYAAGARLREVYPVIPLATTQALAIGVTSYDGNVYFGINADRDATGDLDLFASMIDEAIAELRVPDRAEEEK